MNLEYSYVFVKPQARTNQWPRGDDTMFLITFEVWQYKKKVGGSRYVCDSNATFARGIWRFTQKLLKLKLSETRFPAFWASKLVESMMNTVYAGTDLFHSLLANDC